MTTAEMKKGLSGLATIGTTAPFIGLFGTVIGIINAFRGMAMSGSGGIAAVSAGIAEALVTTAFGLFVAIPAVWMYNYFLNNVERFQVEMSNSARRAHRLLHQAPRRGRATRSAVRRPIHGHGRRRQAATSFRATSTSRRSSTSASCS